MCCESNYACISRPQLSSLQPVQLTELEAEFAKIDGHKAVPTRYLRSQQEKQAKMAAEAVVGDGKFAFYLFFISLFEFSLVNTILTHSCPCFGGSLRDNDPY